MLLGETDKGKNYKFSLVAPKGLDANNAKNIHIVTHPCKDGIPSIKTDTTTLCGEDLARDAKKHLSYKCKGEQEIRERAAKTQESNQVCGRCVARLYADDK